MRFGTVFAAMLLFGVCVLGAGAARPQDSATMPSLAGATIAFVKGARGSISANPVTPTVYVVKADGSGETRVGGGDASVYRPTWAPDGTSFAFGWNGYVYLANPDGTGQRRITRGGRPQWSPDGTHLVVTKADGLYLVRADGRTERRLLRGGHGGQLSPDGRWIVFNGSPVWDYSGIHVVRVGGSRAKKLAQGHSPHWSPDGKQLLFQGYDTGNPYLGIFVINADGSGRARLAEGFTFESSNPWSPDGRRIVFVETGLSTGGPSGISVINRDGRGLTRLVNSRISATPAWAPDGRKIVFTDGDENGSDLFVMNADGSGRTRLTNDREPEGEAAWQPLAADLVISSTGPKRAAVGRDVTYRLTVRNRGTAFAPRVLLRLHPGAPQQLMRVSTSRGSCRHRQTIVCTLGSLEPRMGAEAVIVMSAGRPGVLRTMISAATAGHEPNRRNNRLELRTQVSRG